MIRGDYTRYLYMYKAMGYKVFMKYKDEILYYSKRFDIDPEIIFFLITNEQMNRGNCTTKLIEFFIATFLPSFAIKKDLSIGLGQIKISTAKNVFQKNILPKQLINPEFNIYCVTYLVKNMGIFKTKTLDVVPEIVKAYILGENNKKLCTREQKLYVELCKWSYKYSYFNRLRRTIKVSC